MNVECSKTTGFTNTKQPIEIGFLKYNKNNSWVNLDFHIMFTKQLINYVIIFWENWLSAQATCFQVRFLIEGWSIITKCIEMPRGLYWLHVNTGLVNVLVPPGKKPFHDLMLT